MIIAIHGLTASGKGTLSKRLSEIYGLKRLDTGALYRAVALSMLDAGDPPEDAELARVHADKLDLENMDEHRIRSSEVGWAAAVVSAHRPVRDALMAAQRKFASAPEGAVLDGRDIGTVICPDADVKLFVVAELDERTRRRLKELEARGEAIEFGALRAQIDERDARDIARPIAPLRQAPDAHLLDTTSLSIEEAVAAARRIVDLAVKPRGA